MPAATAANWTIPPNVETLTRKVYMVHDICIESPAPAIGGVMPGYSSRFLRPVVRVESWGPIGLALEPIDPRDRAADGWSAPPDYRVTTPHTRLARAARVKITGRTLVRWGGDTWCRAQLELCGDGEPSISLPAWILAK